MTDRTVTNVHFILGKCIANLQNFGNEKDKVFGTIELLNLIAKKFNYYDENNVYLVDYTGDTSILVNLASEIILILLNLLRFSTLSTDLLLHALIIEVIFTTLSVAYRVCRQLEFCFHI